MAALMTSLMTSWFYSWIIPVPHRTGRELSFRTSELYAVRPALAYTTARDKLTKWCFFVTGFEPEKFQHHTTKT
jgi:hypothetical protein